ncbi:MAG: Rieske (2Fe-2S) protein [Acidimicrobiia bacterium]
MTDVGSPGVCIGSYRHAVADDVPEGHLVGGLVNGQQIVMARVDGELYALDGECTHQYIDLCNSRLKGETIVCHLHGSGFNVKTGAVVKGPATEPLRAHVAKVQGERILVGGEPACIRVTNTGLHDNG